jgi:hypothetical protein
MGIGAAIAAVCSLLLPLLQWWISRSPGRAKEDRTDAIQQGRQDIADGNADAVSARIDRVPQTAGSAPVLGDDASTKERILRITIR